MLFARLLGRVARSRDEHRQVVRVSARAGRSLRDMPLREQGCSLLAIKRAGTFLPVTAEAFVQSGDDLYICGGTEAVKLVAELLGC